MRTKFKSSSNCTSRDLHINVNAENVFLFLYVYKGSMELCLRCISYAADICVDTIWNSTQFAEIEFSNKFFLREKRKKQKNLYFSLSSTHLSLSLFLSLSCSVCIGNPSAIDRSIKRFQLVVLALLCSYPSPDARQVSPQVLRLGHKTNACVCGRGECVCATTTPSCPLVPS